MPREPGVTGHRDSAALRAQVDAALDPAYERAFGLLDVLTAHRHRHGADHDDHRVRRLSEELTAQIERLERGRGGRRP